MSKLNGLLKKVVTITLCVAITSNSNVLVFAEGDVDSSNIIVEDTTVVNEESSNLNEESSVVLEESSTIVEESSVVDEESSVIVEESSIVNEESSVVVEESSIVNEESSVLMEESSIMNEESSLITEESSAMNEESTVAPEIKDTSVEENVQAGAQTTESTTPDALKQLASGSKAPGNILNNQIDNTNIQNLDKQDGSAVDTSRKWETGEIVITTPEELIEFATLTQADGYLGNCEGRIVKLGNDIDLSGYDWYYRDAAGTIVSDHRIPEFIGTLDGQKHTIKNMTYRDEYTGAAELNTLAFIIQGKSFIKNLSIDGINVNTAAPAYFAGLIKDYAWTGSNEGTVEGCHVKNAVVNAEKDLTFGGMFYRVIDGKKIENCHVVNMVVNVKGALVGDNGGRNGGFAATGGESMTMTDCSVTNLVVNTESASNYLGGFIGGASMTGQYYNCDVTGFQLIAQAKFNAVGGFAGYTAGSAWGSGITFDGCDVTGLDVNTADRISVGAGGFIGNLYGEGTSIEDGAHHFVNCTTQGTISGNAYAGGFAGWLYGRSNGCAAEFKNCSAAVNVINNEYNAAAFVGNFIPSESNKMITQYINCTASGNVFGKEPIGSFKDGEETTIDGIIGGTYNYDPENVDTATGEVNNVAVGYRALDNGDGTWTVFPDNGKEVVKVAFHRWNDEKNDYENWRTVEVFKDVDFFEELHNNALNIGHAEYRFVNGITELDEEAIGATTRKFNYWTDVPNGSQLALDNEIEFVADMNVYAAYETEQIDYELPATGGPGTHWYTISGVILMLVAAATYDKRKKQEN